MDVRIRAMKEADAPAWDALVARSTAGTFLHTRRFLSYHGERFTDCSLMLEDERGGLAGVFPAALDPVDASIVVSHPGISYGGVLHAGELTGAFAVRACEAICAYYSEQGKRLLRYKAVPPIYHRMPAQDDVYALFRMNAVLYRRDLSTAIDLSARGSISERRRRGVKKAQQAGLQVVAALDALEEFWDVLTENLSSRHAVKPVHTTDEMQLLRARFPAEIELLVAKRDGRVLAGVLLFDSERVSHAQYTASTEAGRECGALDAVLETAIERAVAAGRRYFDFGVSTEQAGEFLNEGLYAFKTGFGGAGIVHDFYEIALT